MARASQIAALAVVLGIAVATAGCAWNRPRTKAFCLPTAHVDHDGGKVGVRCRIP